MKRLLFAMFCAAGTTFFAPTLGVAQDREAPAVPQPELVTSSWQLTFSHDEPRTIAIENADGTVEWYWFMTYRVLNDPRLENNNREAILFVPEIIIADDRGGILHANRGIDHRAFGQIKDLVRNNLLESPAEVPGNMLPGPDFVKESVAIWPVSDEDVDEFTIFFGGLYGETAHIPHPVTGEPMTEVLTHPRTGEPMLDHNDEPMTRPIILRRTRAITYATPGTVRNPQRQSIELIEETDVMR